MNVDHRRSESAALELGQRRSELPGAEVSARVRHLWKYDAGYDVKVVVTSNDLSFELELETDLDDPAEAIEATRQALQRLGATMARTFAEPNSLK